MANTPDLWPQGIVTHRVQSPVAILRFQASLLGSKTSNLVQAEVLGRNESARFEYTLALVAPSLNRYTYQLLTIRHEIDLYPVQIDVEPTILKELSSSVRTQTDMYDDEVIVAESEEEFIDILRRIFRSQKASNVIASLMSQSDPDWVEFAF
jgi:hypothetical protein